MVSKHARFWLAGILSLWLGLSPSVSPLLHGLIHSVAQTKCAEREGALEPAARRFAPDAPSLRELPAACEIVLFLKSVAVHEVVALPFLGFSLFGGVAMARFQGSIRRSRLSRENFYLPFACGPPAV